MKKSVALLGVALAAAGGLLLWLWLLRARESSAAVSQLANVEAARKVAEERARLLDADNENLRNELTSRGVEPPPRAVLPPHTADDSRVETVRQLTAAQTRLAAVTAQNQELQAKVQELEESAGRLAAESKRVAASEAAAREDLDQARRVIEATEAELKAKSERLVQLEAAARRAREDLDAATKRSAVSSADLNELTDLNRRRETLVQTLQRRYRDLTNELRNIAVRIDTQRDNPAAAAPDISRIQTGVQSSEDDLRQLSALNTQAQRVAQRLGQK
jgi:chromosome segregation ATPase